MQYSSLLYICSAFLFKEKINTELKLKASEEEMEVLSEMLLLTDKELTRSPGYILGHMNANDSYIKIMAERFYETQEEYFSDLEKEKVQGTN